MKTRKPMLWLVLIALLLAPGMAFAAASVCTVHAPQNNGAGMWSQLIEWTGASTNGAFTQCVLGYPVNGVLAWVETDPGSTAPTDDYDITLTDDLGLALTVSDCDNATSAIAKPTVSGSAQAVPVWGGLKLDIANNSVASASGKIRLFWFEHE